MTSAPSFVFASHATTRLGTGVAQEFGTVARARAALASGSAASVTGAFAFDPAGPAALLEPATAAVVTTAASSPGPMPTPIRRTITSPETHKARIVRALDAIDAGEADKIVLARTLALGFAEPLDPHALVARFVPGPEAPTTTAFAVPLDPAGRPGGWLIGASPELLVRRRGRTVTCHPFAGSAPRHPDPGRDQAARRSLESSGKDHREHAFVVDAIVEALRPLCTALDHPDAPLIESTPTVWHLSTPIRGVLADDAVTALDLAATLSPTPAVCGTPTAAAARLIAEIEGERDFYAGAVGWCDAAGDGDWMVSIRCLELSGDHRGVLTWAGGGIVAGSDPDAEVAETDAKFAAVLGALGQS